MDGALRILVVNRLEQAFYFHFDIEFLPQFPAQARLESLASASLASGKLPQAPEMIIRAPLGDQNTAAAKDKSGCDFNRPAFQISPRAFQLTIYRPILL